MTGTKSNNVLLEQRASVACAGPSVSPILELHPSHSTNFSVIKSLTERSANNNYASTGKPGKKLVNLDNKTACQLLGETAALSSSKRVVSPLVAYVASGGVCPPLTLMLAKMKSTLMPATLPIHLLLNAAFTKPHTPCIVEPVAAYYRAVLRRELCISGPGLVPGSAYSTSSSEWMSKENSLPTDVLGTKEWTLVEAELTERFGNDMKLCKSSITHSVGDVVRLAFGFAAGIRTLTFSSDPINGMDTPAHRDEVSSDDDSENHKKEMDGSSHGPVSRLESTRTALIVSAFGEETYYPNSQLSVRVPMDCSLTDPSTSLPLTLYKQSDKVLGKVRCEESHPPTKSDVKYQGAIGLLMTSGIESYIISMGCPIADVVPYQIDPFQHSAESLCSILTHGHFGTIVVDDIGFELLTRTHSMWRNSHQTTAWPIKVIITTSLFEFNLGETMDDAVTRLMSEVSVVDINDVIIKDLYSSVMRLCKFRANREYSLSEVDTANNIITMFPRVLGISYHPKDASLFAPLWSQNVMGSVAGFLSLIDKSMDWSIDKSDVIMQSRIELPTHDALDDELNLETATAYQVSLAVLAHGGRIAMVPLTRLMFQCLSAQDAIKALKPTIAIGTTETWAAFTKRLAHESGIDGAVAKTWKHKMINKRCNSSEHNYDKSKEVVKDFFFRKLVDPLAFRHGRQLLGSHIRLAIVVDPVDADKVMHQSSLATLSMLISSKRDLKIVQAFSTCGLGGQPLAMISASMYQSNPQVPHAPAPDVPDFLGCHTGDPTYSERSTYDRRISLTKAPFPKELLDAEISAPSVAPCLVNPSLDFMLSGVDETSYPLHSPRLADSSPDPSMSIQCRLARAIRLSSNVETSTGNDVSKVFISGTFGQMQDGFLSGPLIARVCLDGKSRQKYRFEGISNFLKVHCFHILNVTALNRISSDLHHKSSLLASSAPRSQYLYDGGSLVNVCIDVDVEINPLCTSPGTREAQERAATIVRDSIRTQGLDLQVKLTGSVLSYFCKLWPQGLVPENHNNIENVISGRESVLDPSTRDIVDGVLKRHGSNLVIDKCRTTTHGLSTS